MELLLSGELFFAAMLVGSIYVLVAIGLNLIYGTMRLLNVAHGDLVMIGAYVSYWLFVLTGMSPLISMIFSAAITSVIGVAIYLSLFRRFLDSPNIAKRIEANSLLIFFGISTIFQNVAVLMFDATPRGYRYRDDIIQLGNFGIAENRLIVLAFTAALCAIIIAFLRSNIYGLAIKALIQHRDAAAVVGIDIERVQILSFAAGFGIAGLAGSLLSMTEQISPFMGFPFTIGSFVVVILGGLGNLGGGMAAGMFLGIVETYVVAMTSPSLRSVLVNAVFIIALFFRPEGLLSGRRKFR